MNEIDIQNLIRLALAKIGLVLFRVNTGMGWIGKVTQIDPFSIMIRNPRPLHAGLTRGGSDLIGWNSILITPEMVGKHIAVFTAIECKTEDGKTRYDQFNFLNQVNKAGGIAIIARSEKDAVGEITKWCQKMKR